MGKLLAQHLQDIISMLFYILLLESQELKADIFSFPWLENIHKSYNTSVSLIFIGGH